MSTEGARPGAGRLWLAAKAALVLLLILMAMGYVSFEGGPEAKVPRASTGPLVQGLPTLYEFGRGICPTCRQMEPVISGLARQYQGRLNVRSVNVDEEEGLAGRFGINLIPTQVLLDAQGREVARHVGFASRDDLVAELKSLKLLP